MTPLDIEMKEFKKVIIGGYNTDQVDEFMGRVTREFENILREQIELQHKVDQLNDKLGYYKGIEQSLQDTMMLADRTAKNAEREANEKAEQLLLESTFQSDQMVENARNEVYTIKQNIDGLQDQYKSARNEIKQILRNQLDILDSQEHKLEELTAISGTISEILEPQELIAQDEIASTTDEEVPSAQPQSENFYTKEYQIINEEDVI